VTQSRHPTNDDANQDGRLGASGRESAEADSLARRWLSPHRSISKDRLTPYLRAFQFRRKVFRKPGKEALKTSSKLRYDSPTIYATRALV